METQNTNDTAILKARIAELEAMLSPIGADGTGMTLRDHFAARAMQGLLAMKRAGKFVNDDGLTASDDEDNMLFAHTNYLAQEAYMISDMMLKARQA